MRIQKVPGGAVTHLAYSPDGRRLYTLDSGGWLSAWDTATFAGGRIAHGPWAKTNFPRGLYALADGKLLIRPTSSSSSTPRGRFSAFRRRS